MAAAAHAWRIRLLGSKSQQENGVQRGRRSPSPCLEQQRQEHGCL
jgi:hypothetical protein